MQRTVDNAQVAQCPTHCNHRLGHVALRVQDMERAKRFYLGLGLRLTWEADDWCYAQWPTGEGIALLSPDYKAVGPHFAFHLRNRSEMEQMREQLLAQGHSCGPVHDHRDGSASFYMQDPEGNWLELLREPPSGLFSNIGAEPIPLTYSAVMANSSDSFRNAETT